MFPGVQELYVFKNINFKAHCFVLKKLIHCSSIRNLVTGKCHNRTGHERPEGE
jgi:hypothetical protein